MVLYLLPYHVHIYYLFFAFPDDAEADGRSRFSADICHGGIDPRACEVRFVGADDDVTFQKPCSFSRRTIEDVYDIYVEFLRISYLYSDPVEIVV